MQLSEPSESGSPNQEKRAGMGWIATAAILLSEAALGVVFFGFVAGWFR